MRTQKMIFTLENKGSRPFFTADYSKYIITLKIN